jgi:hypothetical protein
MKTWITMTLSGFLALLLSFGMANALEEQVKEICQPDIAAYCMEVQDDDDALQQCLEENEDVVSAQCREALEESTES